MFCTIIVLAICAYYIWDWYQRQPRVDGIQKKGVFITGCDSGFGNALARRLDVLGVPVFAGCFAEKGAKELKEQSSERMQTVVVDVASHESITQAYEFVRNNLPDGTELWGIVNNAGIGGNGGPLEYMTRKDFLDVYDVNLLGPIDVTETFLPLLKKSEGRVVITSSAIAMSAFPTIYPYLTAKVAVRTFAAAFRLEKEPYGISVSCVLPGSFLTPIVDVDTVKAKAAKQWSELPQEVKDEFGEDYQRKRVAGIAKSTSIGTRDLSPVVDAYEHALFARKPRAEYYAGKDSLFMSYLTLLPSAVVNFFFMKVVIGAGPKDAFPVPKYLTDKEKKKK